MRIGLSMTELHRNLPYNRRIAALPTTMLTTFEEVAHQANMMAMCVLAGEDPERPGHILTIV